MTPNGIGLTDCDLTALKEYVDSVVKKFGFCNWQVGETWTTLTVAHNAEIAELNRQIIELENWQDTARSYSVLIQQRDQAMRRVEELEAKGEVVVTKDDSGAIVAVTRQDCEGQVLSVIAESDLP